MNVSILNIWLIDNALTLQGEVSFWCTAWLILILSIFLEYYVKVKEIFSGHKVKTKRTPATDGERHPIFCSSLSFQVPVQRLSHTSLVLTLVGCGKMRSSKAVGRAILGPGIFASDSERSHWGRMIMSPLMKVEQWHELYL